MYNAHMSVHSLGLGSAEYTDHLFSKSDLSNQHFLAVGFEVSWAHCLQAEQSREVWLRNKHLCLHNFSFS